MVIDVSVSYALARAPNLITAHTELPRTAAIPPRPRPKRYPRCRHAVAIARLEHFAVSSEQGMVSTVTSRFRNSFNSAQSESHLHTKSSKHSQERLEASSELSIVAQGLIH